MGLDDVVFAEMVALKKSAGRKVITLFDEGEKVEVDRRLIKLVLLLSSERKRRVLRAMLKNDSVSAYQLSKLAEVSVSTSYTFAKELLDLGFLEAENGRRGKVLKIKPEEREFLKAILKAVCEVL